MKSVRWGVIGVSGHFLQRVILPLQKLPLVELYGISSRSPEKAKIIAKRYGIPISFASYEELLKDNNVEAVYIPLPNNLHSNWIKKAADAGKHILCEKPLALSAKEAQESVFYAQNKGVLIMEAFMYRFHPQWQRALELVKVGEIGEIQVINTLFVYNNVDPNNIRNIFEAGGGALRDVGCYAVSTARFLMEAEPKRVISLLHRDPSFRTDILSSGILDFGRARSLFTVSTQTFSSQRVDIHGSRGYINIYIPINMFPDVPAKITITTDVGTRELKLGPFDQYALEFEAFSIAVRNNQPVPIPPEDAIKNLKVLDALFKSEKTGNWEKV